MKHYILVISLFFLGACSLKSTTEESKPDSVKQENSEPDTSAPDLESKLTKQEYMDDFSSLSKEQQVSEYKKLRSQFSLQNKQLLFYRSIKLNNLDLIQSIVNELARKNQPILSDYHTDKIHYRYFEWENCDTTLISYLANKVDISASNRQDSIYRMIRAIDANNHDLLKFYLANGYQHLINEKAILTDLFDAMVDASPVNYSLYKGDTLIADFLLASGGMLDKESLTIYSKDRATKYAFRKLVDKGHKEEEILNSSLWNPVLFGELTKVQILLELNSNPNELNMRSASPIFSTIENIGPPIEDPVISKLKIMKLLIRNGANINQQDENGITPLMYTTNKFSSDGLVTIKLGFAELLLASEANTELVDNNGNNFWDHIILNENSVFMEYFLESDLTPKHFKLKYDSIARVEVLDSTSNDNYIDNQIPSVIHLKDTARASASL